MDKLRMSIVDLLDRFDEDDKYQLAANLASLLELPIGADVPERIVQILERELSPKELFRAQALSQIIRDSRIDGTRLMDPGQEDAKGAYSR